jgi:uncharacterized protein
LALKSPKVKHIAVLIFCIVLLGCDPIVNFFAFFPDTKNVLPAEKLPPAVEEVFFNTSDNETLQAYLLENKNAKKLLIYFHGNAGNISHRLSDLLTINKMNITVLGISYRGYGKSSGTPSEKGIYTDGYAAFTYATQTLGFSPGNIFIFGRSIGTTVAVNTAQHKNLAGLILVTPLSSGKAQAKAQGFGLLSFVAENAFDNLSKMPSIKCPLLVIHGTMDEVLSYAMGKEIYEAAKTEKQFVTITGGGHNNLSFFKPDQYWGAIKSFISKTGR